MERGRFKEGFVWHPMRPLHAIAGAATAVAGFVGWATQGPVGEAVVVKSWTDYRATFGEMVPGVWLGYAVWQFFGNGGSEAYVVGLDNGAAAGMGETLVPNTEAFETALTGPGGYAVLQGARFNLLCVPGESTAAVVAELQAFSAEQKAFLIVDSAETASAAGLVGTGPADGAGVSLVTEGAENSGFYFPWVMVAAPVLGDDPIAFPPCGMVAGMMARSDASHGVWKAAAGVEASLSGVLGLQVELTDAESEALNGRGVNCLRQFPAYGSVVWGARTIAGSDTAGSEWKYVPVRRLALFLESSLEQGLQWVVFEPNAEPLWAEIRLSVGTFLQGLFEQGALMGSTPDQAYFVKCDGENNSQANVDAGVVNITVGFAPLYPAEFVVIQIQQIGSAAS
jgi:phage tail sheath protein FI